MSEHNIETKRKVMESVRKMYAAIAPINDATLVDAIEQVDLAALAIYKAYDITFVACDSCSEDEVTELARNVAGLCLCELCAKVDG